MPPLLGLLDFLLYCGGCAYTTDTIPTASLTFDGRFKTLVEAGQGGIRLEAGLILPKVVVEGDFELRFEEIFIPAGRRLEYSETEKGDDPIANFVLFHSNMRSQSLKVGFSLPLQPVRNGRHD